MIEFSYRRGLDIVHLNQLFLHVVHDEVESLLIKYLTAVFDFSQI